MQTREDYTFVSIKTRTRPRGPFNLIYRTHTHTQIDTDRIQLTVYCHDLCRVLFSPNLFCCILNEFNLVKSWCDDGGKLANFVCQTQSSENRRGTDAQMQIQIQRYRDTFTHTHTLALR